MAPYVYLILSLVLVTLTSCASERKTADSVIEFENVKKEFVGQKSEFTGDPITVSFDIDWPKSGNEEVVKTLQTWILSNISPIALALKEGEPLISLLEEASPKILDNLEYEGFNRTAITVKAEPNVPFEGFITLHEYKSTHTGMGMGGEDSYSDITIRLSDNKQFNYNTAIEDTELFRQMIINNIDWWDNDVMYGLLSNIPYPTFPIGLTKDGVEVRYDSSLGRSHLGFEVTIPYSEAYAALSEDAKKYLPTDITNSSNTSKGSTDDVETDATAFLYSTFYSNDAISGEVSNVGRYSLGYSEEAMQKFKELGISSELDYPQNTSLANDNDYYKPYYSDDLNNLLKKVTTALNNTDNFELMMLMGYDFEGEEPSFNLHINKVDVESPEKVTITAKENPEGDEVSYRLIKQNGKWYIDDIYNYREKAKTILEN